MRTNFFLALITGLVVAGCGQNEPAKPAASPAPATAPAAAPAAKEPEKKADGGGSVLTAPVDYLGAAAKAKKSADVTVDTAALNQQVQLFFAQEGRFPKDLDELVSMKYMKALPVAPYGMKIEYNAANGQVKVVKQ